MTWNIGDHVVYARHLPDDPNVQRFHDDRDIGRAGIVSEVVDAKVYGSIHYLVLWDEPYRPFGSIGRCCASEQLATTDQEPRPAEIPPDRARSATTTER